MQLSPNETSTGPSIEASIATPITALHILNKPPGHGRFPACLEQLNAGDTLFLLEDGVLALHHPLLRKVPSGVSVYALEADGQARGLIHSTGYPENPVGYNWCDMSTLVTLTEQYSRIANW